MFPFSFPHKILYGFNWQILPSKHWWHTQHNTSVLKFCASCSEQWVCCMYLRALCSGYWWYIMSFSMYDVVSFKKPPQNTINHKKNPTIQTKGIQGLQGEKDVYTDWSVNLFCLLHFSIKIFLLNIYTLQNSLDIKWKNQLMLRVTHLQPFS